MALLWFLCLRRQVVEVAGKGRGVVCNAPIPSGRYVAEYRGQLLTGADALAREQHYAALPPDQDPGCYLFFFRHNDKLHWYTTIVLYLACALSSLLTQLFPIPPASTQLATVVKTGWCG